MVVKLLGHDVGGGLFTWLKWCLLRISGCSEGEVL